MPTARAVARAAAAGARGAAPRRAWPPTWARPCPADRRTADTLAACKMRPRGGAGLMPAPPRIWRPCNRGSGACGAAAGARCSGGRGGSHEKRSDGLGNQPETGSPSAPASNANEALGRARESSAQDEKIAAENFLQKVIDGLLKLPYTDKCRWQAFPPSRKPSDASLSFADPAAGLFSSGPAVSAGRRGFHTPPSPPSSATFSSSGFPANSPAV